LRIHYVLQKLVDETYFRKYTLQAIAEEVGYKDANTLVRVLKNKPDFLLIITLIIKKHKISILK
jgi:AraC-like DNA-binding protein